MADDVIELDSPRVTVRHEGLARRLGWTAAMGAAIPCVAGMAIPAGLSPLGPLLLWMFATAPLVAIVAALVRSVGPGRPARLRIDGKTLRVTDARRERVIPLGDIAHGWLLPGAPHRIEWALRSGAVLRADLTDVRHGDALLAASGMDASQRALSMSLSTGPGLFALGALGFVISICPATMLAAVLDPSVRPLGEFRGMLWLAVVVAGVAATLALFAPPRITIGADGVSIRRALRTRFIPFGRINSVTNDPLEILLVLDGGGLERIPLAELAIEPRRALFTRIEEARLASRHRVTPPAVAEVLDRNGRSIAEWRSTLSAMLRGSESYRTVALQRTDLLRVLGDPAAPSERRIGAALALAADGSDEGRSRVRVVAEACASEPLRMALNRAADGALEPAELEAAVAPVETDRPHRA